MNSFDVTERSILESELNELKLKNAELAHQVIDFALHGDTWSKLLKYLPVSVYEDIAAVLEYGQHTHDPDAWKTADNVQHATDHLGNIPCTVSALTRTPGKARSFTLLSAV